MRRLRPAVDIVAEIAAIHDRRTSTSEPNIIPVLVQRGSEVRPLLAALTQAVGGHWFDVEEDDPSIDIENSSLPRAVKPMLEACLSVGSRIPQRTLVVESLPDDHHRVTFAELKSLSAASDAERHIVSLARSFIDPQFYSTEFCVISYSESLLDNKFRHAAWSLIPQIRLLHPEPLKTLVVLVETTTIDVGLHCQKDFGFRYGHLGDRPFTRNPTENMAAHITRMLAPSNTPLVLFLGAGSSATSGLPLGNRLRDNAIRRMLGGSIDGTDSEALAQQFFRAYEQLLTPFERQQDPGRFSAELTFERVIAIEQTHDPNLPTLQELAQLEQSLLTSPGLAVQSLHRLIRSGHRLVIVTVNLDRFIETDVASSVKVFASEDQFAEASDHLDAYLAGRSDLVPVLKVHGSIDDFSTCVVTNDQTETGLSDAKLSSLRRLISTDEPVRWVYIGASMRDRDLTQLFHSTEFGRGAEEYWVNPYLIDSVEDFARPRGGFWRKRDLQTIEARLITETADTFLTELADRIGSA